MLTVQYSDIGVFSNDVIAKVLSNIKERLLWKDFMSSWNTEQCTEAYVVYTRSDAIVRFHTRSTIASVISSLPKWWSFHECTTMEINYVHTAAPLINVVLLNYSSWSLNRTWLRYYSSGGIIDYCVRFWGFDFRSKQYFVNALTVVNKT